MLLFIFLIPPQPQVSADRASLQMGPHIFLHPFLPHPVPPPSPTLTLTQVKALSSLTNIPV